MILDLGGGAGHFAKTLSNYFDYVHLMDFAPITQSERLFVAQAILTICSRVMIICSRVMIALMP
jgi:hypothetical protein